MSRFRWDSAPAAQTKLSRGDVETLCVLHVVGDAGCPAHELAERLGLSRSISAEVAAGMYELVRTGLLELEDGQFTLTAAGRVRLASRSGAGANVPSSRVML